MITTVELHRAAEDDGLRFDQAEKDYVILWCFQDYLGPEPLGTAGYLRAGLA